MKRIYLGAVMGKAGAYGIVFRDFPGCVSAGDTVEEVLAMGAEGLQGHVEAVLDAGEFVPAPTEYDIGDVSRWLGSSEDTVDEPWIDIYPIEINVPENSDAVTIRMNASLVKKIAEMSDKNAGRINSRHFIESAVEHELERYRKSA